MYRTQFDKQIQNKWNTDKRMSNTITTGYKPDVSEGVSISDEPYARSVTDNKLLLMYGKPSNSTLTMGYKPDFSEGVSISDPPGTRSSNDNKLLLMYGNPSNTTQTSGYIFSDVQLGVGN